MFSLKLKKQTRGMELIEDVASRFTAMVEELETGVEDCVAERTSIQVQIDSLHDRDSVLSRSVTKAATIAANLHKIVGS